MFVFIPKKKTPFLFTIFIHSNNLIFFVIFVLLKKKRYCNLILNKKRSPKKKKMRYDRYFYLVLIQWCVGKKIVSKLKKISG